MPPLSLSAQATGHHSCPPSSPSPITDPRPLTSVLLLQGVHAGKVDRQRLEGGGEAAPALRALHGSPAGRRLPAHLGRAAPAFGAVQEARRLGGGGCGRRGALGGLCPAELCFSPLCPALPGCAPLLPAGRAAAASTEPPTSGASAQPPARGSGTAPRCETGGRKYLKRRRQDRDTAPAGSGGTSRRRRPQTWLFSARFCPPGWPGMLEAGEAAQGAAPGLGTERGCSSPENSPGERGWAALPPLGAGGTHLQPRGDCLLSGGLCEKGNDRLDLRKAEVERGPWGVRRGHWSQLPQL